MPIEQLLGLLAKNKNKITIDPNFCNVGVGLKSAHSWYKMNTVFGETMMHSSVPWA
jgi:hypothetical protein